MNVEPLKFKEFTADASANVASVATKSGGKPFLPGGRTRGAVPPPPPPTFSEEQLKAAERDGYKKGFLEGTEEGRKLEQSEQAQVDRNLSETVEKFAASVPPLFKAYVELALQLKQEMPKVALSIARKVAGQALNDHAAAVVEDMALRCVEVMISEPKLAITVNDKLAPALTAKVKQLAEKLQSATDITVSGDAAMQLDDCRIDWDHGSCARDSQEMWKNIEQAIANVAAAAKHQTEDNLKQVKAALLETTQQQETKE